MSGVDVFLLLLIAGAVGLAIWLMIRRKKKGGCCGGGCSGDCSCCGGCHQKKHSK